MKVLICRSLFLFGVVIVVNGCGATEEQIKRLQVLEQRVEELEEKYQVAAARFDEIERLNELSYAFQDRLEQVELDMTRQSRKLNRLVTARPRPPKRTAKKRREAPTAAGKELPRGPAIKVAPGATVQDVYSRAYRFLKDERYEESKVLFNYVLATWPKDDLADNALYWLGEIQYARKDYINALKLFEAVPEKYPKGNKVPDAMLKQALCWKRLGDTLKSQQVVRRLKEQFPWSPAAEKADQLLQEAGG